MDLLKTACVGIKSTTALVLLLFVTAGGVISSLRVRSNEI